MATFLVCGDRHWNDEKTISTVLYKLAQEGEYLRLIHGDCFGADKIAGKWGEIIGFDVQGYPADWATYGNSAGPIRNGFMLKNEKIELVLAFHDDIEKSKGTRNMITQARAKKIPVILCRSDGTRKILD